MVSAESPSWLTDGRLLPESSVVVSLCFCADFVLRSSPAILDQGPPE